MGRGLPYIGLVLLCGLQRNTCHTHTHTHTPKSSTHTISFAADLAMEPRPTRSEEAVKAL
jgi:hypothetical protein